MYYVLLAIFDSLYRNSGFKSQYGFPMGFVYKEYGIKRLFRCVLVSTLSDIFSSILFHVLKV